MARVETRLNGISTSSEYVEGDCCSLVNLRSKNGVLQPVSPRKTDHTFEYVYDIVFVHKSSDYQNWIGIINNGDSSHVYTDIKGSRKLLTTVFHINSIEQIGNTLSLITDENIYYILYQNNAYTFLGELPDLPFIEFRPYLQYEHTKYYHSFVSEQSVTPETFTEMSKAMLYLARQESMDIISPMFFDAFFIRYAFRLYDNTLTKHSPPILVMPRNKIEEMMWIDYRFKDGHLNGLSGRNGSVTVKSFEVLMNYNTDSLREWQDIIQSVDIFMSPYIGISSPENIGTHFKTSNDQRWYTDFVVERLTSGHVNKVKENSLFYYVRSLKILLGTQNEKFPENNADTKFMDNLIQREQMTDDSFSHHKYGAKVSYIYNNRLHIADIKTKFFGGFTYGFFDSGSKYNGVEDDYELANQIVIETTIQTDYFNGKVYSSFIPANNVGTFFATSFISYPDPRAKSMTIYILYRSNWKIILSIPLKAHPYLNLAYYVDSELKPLISTENTTIAPPNINSIVSTRESNKIKVSELNNPMNFPNINTYTVSEGDIIALATNLMKVADRNYGQYPMYVFTTQGIWNLNVGDGTTFYSTITAPTHSEAPIIPIVAPTPMGVVFVTQRGLKIINGETVDYISPHLEQMPLPLNMEGNSNFEGVLHPLPNKSFKEFLNGLTDMFYNPYEDEIILCGNDEGFNYVVSLESNSIFQSTEKIDSVVLNLYPDLMIVSDRQIKDYSQSNTVHTHISFMLRPLKYGTKDIKRLERFILRGLFLNLKSPDESKKPFVASYFSMDGINFSILRGLFLKNGNYSDLDLGMFARSKYRQFMLSFAGTLSDDSQIHFLETEMEKEYHNTKMR